MHTPHIKPQNNFGLPLGYQARKTKPKSVEAELITPVPEWARDGKKRKPTSAERDSRAGVEDEQEAPAFEKTARRIDETAGGGTGNTAVEDKDDLFGLLGAFSAGVASPAKRQAASEESASLQDLLSQFADAAESGVGFK